MNVQHARTQALIGLSLAVLAGGAAVAYRSYRPRRRMMVQVYFPRVRDAGPANMKNPPQEWDDVDDMVDQSFPASDPPAYCGPARFK